jgi:hypothetical protein
MKGYYASDFLYISALGFAKLSLVTYFYRIVHHRSQRRMVFGLGIFILVWSCASLAAVAFQCKLPTPWAMMTLDCYNTVSIGILSMYSMNANPSRASSGLSTALLI